MFVSLSIAVLVVFIVIWVRRIAKAFQDVDYLPGFWSLFAPMSLVGAIAPTMPLNPGMGWVWVWRSFAYERFGSDTLAVVPLVLGSSTIYTRSVHVAKQVLSGKPQYWKAPESTIILLVWGDNVISANYDNYKRHRRIVAPGFKTKTYDLVWAQTVKTYFEMMDTEGWASQQSFSVASLNPFMSKFALTIIARCGFGLSFPWKGFREGGQSRMSFDEALSIVSRNAITRLATPNWMYKLPIKALRELDEAYRVLSQYMKSFVSRKKEEIASEAYTVNAGNNDDLFTSLVRASGQDGKLGLSDEELIGNMFAFMFAGHETTAHTLSATLAFLALYPKEQHIVVEQISDVLSDGRHPAIEDMPKLDKVLACFREAARLFPAGSIVTRDPTETAVISVDQADGTYKPITVAPGVRIIIDMVGLNYNPRLYDDPEEFRPSRWYGKSDSDLTTFGFGPRACLGLRFASAESVCLLTMLLKDWTVEPIFNAGETPEMWRGRVLQGTMAGLAFGVKSVPVTFTRRM